MAFSWRGVKHWARPRTVEVVCLGLRIKAGMNRGGKLYSRMADGEAGLVSARVSPSFLLALGPSFELGWNLMSYQMAKGGWAHLAVGGVFLIPAWIGLAMGYTWVGALLALAFVLYIAFMLYFFRDPDRDPPADPLSVVSGADGWIRSVESIESPRDFDRPSVRISTYLTPWDVHVNRAPIGGAVVKLGYTPGKHILTRNPASSEFNEHSTILIHGEHIPCLVRQIVGPLVRRVIYWLEEGQQLGPGARIGMMKFGSRLDVYLPAEQVMVTVKAGDRVFAGITEIARITGKAAHGA